MSETTYCIGSWPGLVDRPVICLMGPTGVGKSDIGFDLASRIPSEIVSVDSAMVYREMDIGTAKPGQAERARIPHHLIDIRDPSERYSAGNFCREASSAIESIFDKGKYPVLIGGTMLYFKALAQGLTCLPSANAEIRQRIAQEAEKVGWNALHQQLQAIDPETARHIHPNDPQRLQRALEIYELTGRPMSYWHKDHSPASFRSFRLIPFALTYEDRSKIHQRVEQRFDQMLKAGFVDEVKKLYARGNLHLDLPSMRSVGYRQVWQYLAGEWDEKTMREKAIIATRQLAKRQLTWLRSWRGIRWIYLDNQTGAEAVDTIFNAAGISAFVG